jgi:RNA polymerase sigma factor (sigma-70 family)
MLHHDRGYVSALQAERRAWAAPRRAPEPPGHVEQMLRAAATGDEAAWQALKMRFTPRVRSVARTYRLGSHDVEDVVQTTWLRLVERIHALERPESVGAWLETTARRESLRVLRLAQREQPTGDELLPEESTAPADESRLAADDRRAALAASLRRLPPRHRRLLALLASESEPSYVEISRALGMPIGSIGPTRARCLERLRQDPVVAGLVDAAA